MSVDLTQVHPLLVAKIGAVLQQMHHAGTPMRITDGFRSVAEQQRLYAQGRTTPGRIVTQCDGIRKPSNHQSGRAVDCAFLGPDPYAESHPWARYGALVRAQGLIWGGDWTKPDRPHAELPAEVKP